MNKLLYWLAACALLIVAVVVDTVYVKYVAGVIGGLMFAIGWLKDIRAAADETIKQSKKNSGR